ncbi:hypothetical protein L596_021935 [Steinernema carpocapsae]|uniref:Uncharacterized protein n=1 Tax=Steinernema carpocapsae TaxID=34508 RepID=A0A4U5MKB2_STECR|nr:hypothetical protein L596_021935 [Steinernema carpocapsae]
MSDQTVGAHSHTNLHFQLFPNCAVVGINHVFLIPRTQLANFQVTAPDAKRFFFFYGYSTKIYKNSQQTLNFDA